MLIVGFAALVSCAIIPDTAQDPKEFHECLVNYLNIINISSSLNSSVLSDVSEECKKMQKAIEETINGVYDKVEENLYNVLDSQTEIECLMETWRKLKFFEVNIILTAAHLTMNGSLDEVYMKSKSIFVSSAMKCIATKEMVFEIIEDLSTRLQVNDDEYNCIKWQLMADVRRKRSAIDELNANEIDVTTETAEDEAFTTTDFSTMTFVELTTMTFQDETFDENNDLSNFEDESKATEENIIEKENSSFEFSNENETNEAKNNETCANHLQNIRSRIINYEISSLNLEENRCVSNKTSEDIVNTAFKFIASRRLNLTEAQTTERNEMMRNLIGTTVWNIIDCTDIFGFMDIVDNLFPKPSLWISSCKENFLRKSIFF